jgi:hypothetical protein
MEFEGSLLPSIGHVTGPYPKPDQSGPYPHPTSLRSILILSSHLRLRLPSGLSPTKLLYKFLYSPMRATFPTSPSSLT